MDRGYEIEKVHGIDVERLAQVRGGIERRQFGLRRDVIEFFLHHLLYAGVTHSLSGSLHVRRAKQGAPSTHPIRGDEPRALRRLQREQDPKSPFVFTSGRGAPFSTAGVARVTERAGAVAKLGLKAHPPMLQHACGYALANKGYDTRALQAYLGHCNIQHTVRYTELAA
jgi:hypothetical protein